MKARVGDLPVGTRFRTLLTGREGVIRAHGPAYDDGLGTVNCGDTVVTFTDALPERRVKHLHPEVRVSVEEYAH